MSDILAELARVRDAFDKPTLRLLDRKWAPLVLAVFRTTFTRDQRAVAAERLHQQVDNYFDELRLAGEPVPDGVGRALCMQWLSHNWLVRTRDDDGAEHYTLTSYTLEALDLVQSLARDRTLISESRIHTILDVVRRFATEANPDRQTRIERLNAQIAELTAERDRLEAGGDIQPATNDQMLDGYTNLLSLIGQLPSDFKRVEEAVAAMHQQIISDFRGETRPIVEVIDDYLAKSDSLMKLTAEGRAFEGAFTLLRDEPLLVDLRRDLDIILTHPFAQALTPAEQREFRRTVKIIQEGIRDVLTQRQRLSATLRDHIVHYNVVHDRELDVTLRQINLQLASWMRAAGPRSRVGIEVVPAKIDVKHLRERFWDPAEDALPPPLEEVSDTVPPVLDLDAIRNQGGPTLTRLGQELIAATAVGEVDSIAAVFAAFPDDLRRPVELLGLIHLFLGARADSPDSPDSDITDAGAHVAAFAREERVEAVRPDGARRVFAMPVLPLRTAAADVLAEGVSP
ncbi:DUF3375 domain-containing protein [Frankia sp. Cr1]|uniref:DUF3375 domain-containing protein n=1 Tax=Frankia sp. Cr1 TaxID=3073931 RepID=UPI002AD3C998|nr:DUF3375 domain-containing protein [Frankia sp. Cr1]